jgi:hypothetical protein
MIVGEGPQIDGGVLVVILVIFLLFVAAVIGVVVAGCVWAARAGRGSERARTGWACVALVEGAVLLRGLAGLAMDGGEPYTAMAASFALGLQGLLYARAKGRTTGAHNR